MVPRQAETDGRLRIHRLADGRDREAFGRDVRAGLITKPKWIPAKYFYDQLGARLFEAICFLPEYYLTRAESEILRQNADEITGLFCGSVRLIELGSGSAEKTRYLIEAWLRRQSQLHYLPVDISASSIESSSNSLLRAYPRLRITGYAADYFTALQHLGDQPVSEGRTIALFLGSNIGNFALEDALYFLSKVRGILRRGDALLLGADLKKPAELLVPAYDDALGVTAAFNRNVLVRMNRELGADFDLSKFEHRAVYNQEAGRIEMHLVSREAQRVTLNALQLEIDFERGESIHSESSYKYDPDDLAGLARQTGFNLARTWFDSEHRFSFNLFEVA